MPPQTNANKENPNRNDHNKKEDEPQLKLNQCPECGLAFRNEKGLKIHRTSKHRRKENATTFLDSGPVTQTHEAKHAEKDSFIQPSPAQTAKNIKLNSH